MSKSAQPSASGTTTDTRGCLIGTPKQEALVAEDAEPCLHRQSSRERSQMVADDTVDGRVADVDRAQDLPQQRRLVGIAELERQEGAALVLEDDFQIMHLVGGKRLRPRDEGNEAVLRLPRPQAFGEQWVVGKAIVDVRARQPHPRRVDPCVEMAAAFQQHHGDQLAWIEKPSGDEDAGAIGACSTMSGARRTGHSQRRHRLEARKAGAAHALHGAQDGVGTGEAAKHVLEMRHHLQFLQDDPTLDHIKVEVRSAAT